MKVYFAMINDTFIPEVKCWQSIFENSKSSPQGYTIELECRGDVDPTIPPITYLTKTSEYFKFEFFCHKGVKPYFKDLAMIIAMNAEPVFAAFKALHEEGKIVITGEEYPVACLKNMINNSLNVSVRAEVKAKEIPQTDNSTTLSN